MSQLEHHNRREGLTAASWCAIETLACTRAKAIPMETAWSGWVYRACGAVMGRWFRSLKGW